MIQRKCLIAYIDFGLVILVFVDQEIVKLQEVNIFYFFNLSRRLWNVYLYNRWLLDWRHRVRWDLQFLLWRLRLLLLWLLIWHFDLPRLNLLNGIILLLNLIIAKLTEVFRIILGHFVLAAILSHIFNVGLLDLIIG